MLNVESRIYLILKQIRRAKNTTEANQYAYYAIGLLEAKREDGKITGEMESFLLGKIGKEVNSVEQKIKNKTIDKTLDLFRSRKESSDGERSRKNITLVKGNRKRGIS